MNGDCMNTFMSTHSELVLHFKPEQDIQVIGGDLDYSLLESLTNSYDRLCATKYFTNEVQQHCNEGKHTQAAWHFRSAISELQSFGEIFPSDLPSAALAHVWDRSDIKADVDNHELLSVLTRARHLSLHTAKLPCIVKDLKVIHLPGGERVHTSLFIGAIQEDYDGRGRPIPADKLKWFNRQVELLPAHWILTEALFIAALARINFLVKYEHLNDKPP